MAGILLNEGLTKGALPTMEVLSVGSVNQARQPSDLLPYAESTRHYFGPLLNTQARVIKVPISDLECITMTAARVKGPVWYLKIKGSEASKVAERELSQLCQTWTFAQWNEYDYLARVKEVQIRDIIELRKQHRDAINASHCLSCPDFIKHFTMCHDEWLIKENILQLRQLMSDQNLQLLPDYEQRILVLKDLGFVDDSSRVQLKGKVACEIHSADELVLTELILENVLSDFEPAEIVALLSAFVFQEKTDVEPTLTPRLEKGKATIIQISEKVNAIQTRHQVILSSEDSNDFVSRPRFGLVEVVHEWARGMSFNRITDLTDVLEGTIVRVVTRLDETCREVKNAARIIGDPKLFAELQAAQEMIKRDITAVASLYM